MQGLVPPPELGLLAEAKALMNWHQRHRFCPNCGAPSRPSVSGFRRDCPSCSTQHFPRTDPVAIMLAVRGDHCLLGRSARFASRVYSALAGFIEHGETIEAAVRREIKEEAGVSCGRVTYLASQPWPFPMSLMIGCHAEALTDEITIDREELEDARWFSRAECASILAGAHPEVACPAAVRHRALADQGVRRGGLNFRRAARRARREAREARSDDSATRPRNSSRSRNARHARGKREGRAFASASARSSRPGKRERSLAIPFRFARTLPATRAPGSAKDRDTRCRTSLASAKLSLRTPRGGRRTAPIRVPSCGKRGVPRRTMRKVMRSPDGGLAGERLLRGRARQGAKA